MNAIRTLLTVPVLLLVSCAMSPLETAGGVGAGRYLQVFDANGRVALEMDTHNAGLLNCPNQAHQLMQSSPALQGHVKCSDKSFSGSLPFSYVAHRRLSESDGYLPSSPYLTRAMSSDICTKLRQETSKLEKTVILEDKCGGSQATTSEERRIESRPSPATRPANIGDSIKQLDQLKRDGLVSEDEYRARKKAILDRL